MKKLIVILFVLFFASSASATIYRWVDEKGVVNFTDDDSKIPPDYRNKVEVVKPAKTGSPLSSQPSPEKTTVRAQPGETTTEPPPISQVLIREGEFAVKLAGALNMGEPKSEAEAETILTSVGITPKNGWIADYPMTPDIIGELENAVGSAVDAGKLRMKQEEAAKAFQDLVVQQGLPVKVDGRQNPSEPPQDYGNPEAVSDYYYNEGPPVVTYYPPPWDYNYLYAWVPYPFWYTGFWFPGFFVLRDFHRGFVGHGRAGVVSNHFSDPRTGGFRTIDPATRHLGNTVAGLSRSRGEFTSQEASSIVNHSSGNTRLNNTPGNRGYGAGSSQSGRMSGYSSSGRVVTGRPTFGNSFGHAGSFSAYGRGTGRSFSAPSGGGRSSFGSSHSGGFGGSRGGGHGGGHR